MVTYILLVNFTDKGRQNFKKGYVTTREEFKAAVARMGGKMTGYVTAGSYDAVEIIDMPNDDTALSLLLGGLSVDDIRYISLRAFSESDVKKTLQTMQ